MSTIKRQMYPGNTTSDITLSRGRDDFISKQGNSTERILLEKEDHIIEQANTIRSLQHQGKYLRKSPAYF